MTFSKIELNDEYINIEVNNLHLYHTMDFENMSSNLFALYWAVINMNRKMWSWPRYVGVDIDIPINIAEREVLNP